MSQVSIPSPGAPYSPSFHPPPRPMLARDADSMYWMSRYVERAEHVARIMWVNSNLLVDVGDLAPALQERQWESVLTIFHVAGIDKQLVGQVAAEIRSWRPPEPYKGKGVRYEGEYVRRKDGKKK